MADAIFIEQALWPMTSFAMALLLFLLVVHKSYRVFPAFCCYMAASLLQSAALVATYRVWGFSSPIAWRMGWITQVIVLCARTTAVVELCRHVLVRFRGIWALAWRLLIASAALVLIFAAIFGRHEWQVTLTTAEIAVELAIAAIIILLLLFARYYQVPASAPVRALAFGLGFYSCVSVINDAVLERWLAHYVSLWNAMGMAAFLVSLLIWTWAFRNPIGEPAAAPVCLDRKSVV